MTKILKFKFICIFTNKIQLRHVLKVTCLILNKLCQKGCRSLRTAQK